LINATRHRGDPKILQTGRSSIGPEDRLAKMLGWFSFALGMTELLAAGAIAKALGLENGQNLIRAFGAREIAAGALTLSTEKQAGLVSRVAGDGLDILTLLHALRRANPKRGYAAAALALVLGVTFLDLLAMESVTARNQRDRPRRLYQVRSGFPNRRPAPTAIEHASPHVGA